MDLDKKYYTTENVECNILQLVKMEPEWAAHRIQAGEKAIEQLEGQGGKGQCSCTGSSGDDVAVKGGRQDICETCTHWLNRRCEELEKNADLDIYNDLEYCDELLQIHTPSDFGCNHYTSKLIGIKESC